MLPSDALTLGDGHDIGQGGVEDVFWNVVACVVR